MKRIVVVVHWLGLLLAFDLVKSNHSTQIQPDTSQVQNNATRQEKSLKDASFLETITNITQISEKQLSASERNRRLIPYMAFYLPPSDIPINQAYAIQRPKQHTSNYQLPPTAADSAGPLPPPANIPIPTAYMHMKLPTVATAQQTDISQDYPNAGDVYHKIAYGSAHYPLPASLKNTGKKIPILHLLPPGHSAPAAPTLITYKHNSGPQRQKTVQYFPPLNTQTKTQPIQQEHQQLQLQQQQQQQQDHQEQQILYQPPVKQSKINLTPFTSSNTLPGHFIPIIYTPMNNANNNNDNNKNQQHNGNIINYNYADNKPTIEESPQIQQVEKQPHLDTHNQVEQHQQQQQHLQNVAELELLQSAPKHSPKASHSHSPPQQQHQQLQFITDTGLPALTSPQLPQSGVHQPVAVVHPTANPSQSPYIDYIIEEPKQSLDEEQHGSIPTQQLKITAKPTSAPPQAAYIVITTALPPATPTSAEYYGSTVRPAYKKQPTIRLQAVAQEEQQKNYPTRRPTIIAPQLSNTAYSNKPNYKQVAIKLQSSNDYEEGIESTPTPQQLETEHVTPTPTSAKLPAYYAGDSNKNQQHAPQSIPDPNQLPDIRSSSLAEILHKLQASNHLPQTLTADNIDNSIKTLITILNNLKQTQTIVANPPQHHETPTNAADYDYNAGGSQEEHGTPPTINVLTPIKPNKHPGPSTGRPGIDYPNYAEIPQTSFDCTQQRYKGFFGDPETNCQVWHYCDLNGGKASFLCPNGTIFSQIALTCDWWFNVKCSTTAQLYVLNERLYKYILPFTPKFPEDYSGPLVDKYLAMKFQEMEEKTHVHKDQKEVEKIEEPPSTDNNIEETTLNVEPINPHKHEAKNSYVSEQSSERNLLIDDEGIDDDDDNNTKSAKPATQEITTPATSTNSTDLELSLSLKPIVVSSTEGPDYAQNSSEEQETKESNEEQHKRADMKKNNKSENSREPTKFKVSVEKVEVIEIKSDGTSGHITPAELYETR
ncbi:LIM and SH3 domain protein Lasp [Teleopsis dalmanni]|uniref:LIM and SH3 domain protein Lasp n=1 Tax=Teleopsis dalmanni TaxID=139649 RepID=UPI0018CD254A|nr:LIM and SH3 domain protein Lasp [Teleopsis dalmanni]